MIPSISKFQRILMCAKCPPFLTSETTFLLGIISSKNGIIGFIAFLDVSGKKMVVKT